MDTTTSASTQVTPSVSRATKPTLSVLFPVNESSKTAFGNGHLKGSYPGVSAGVRLQSAVSDNASARKLDVGLPDYNAEYSSLQKDGVDGDADKRADGSGAAGLERRLAQDSVNATYSDYVSGYYNDSRGAAGMDYRIPTDSNSSTLWEWLATPNNTQPTSLAGNPEQPSWNNYNSSSYDADRGDNNSWLTSPPVLASGEDGSNWSSLLVWPATTRASTSNFTWGEAHSVTGYLFDYVTGGPKGMAVGGQFNNVTAAVSNCSAGLECLVSLYDGDDGSRTTSESKYNWWFLLVLLFMAAGGLGNVLVCLAICLERRLQNVTNYFLLSLAVADLLVSLVVMPFGIVVGFLGYWPFGAAMCNVYVTCDVLSCSSSIMHMCFISMGRYLGIRNPLKTRNNSKKAVVVKMVLVWLLSMVITSPITLLGITDSANIIPEPKVCAINNRFFFIFGSLFAFYIPMVIMVIAYVLTVQLLRKQAKFDDAHQARRLHLTSRRSKLRPADSDLQEPLRGKSQQVRDPNSFRGGGSGSRRGQTGGDDGGKSASTPESPSGGPPTNNGHIIFPQYSNRISQPFNERHHPDVCECGTQTPSSLLDRNQTVLSCPSLAKSPHSRRIHDSGNGNGRLEEYDPNKRENDGGGSERGGSGRQFRFPLKRAASSVHFKFLPNRRRSVKSISSVATEQKASKVLGLVFFAFVICWTPFFLLNIIFAACPSCPVSERIVNTSLWLGYVSSTINPVIYTIFNRTFKEAFVRLLTCRCVGNRRRRWYGRSGIGGAAYFSAADSLAQAPIKLVGCIRTSSFPPSSYSDGSETVC